MARAILEYQPDTAARKANQEWALVGQIHDPSAPQGVQDLINRLSILARGAPNGPWNGFTSADGIQQALNAFGLSWQAVYTNDVGAATVVQRAQATSLALLWVDGSGLWPSAYSGSFFGGDWGWDHIILSLPDGNLFNDPLTDDPDRATDVRYAWDAVQSNIGGAWLLPNPEGLATTAKLVAAAALKVQPNHVCKAVGNLPAGAVVSLMAGQTPHWREVRDATGRVGWLLKDNLK